MAVAPALAAAVSARVPGMRWLQGVVMTAALHAGAAAAATHVMVVAGLGGEPQFDERFAQWSDRIALASVAATGDPGNVHRLHGAGARREAIEQQLQQLAGSLREGDQFVLVLLGHGSFDGSEYRFNLVGPDITGTQIATLLDRIPSSVAQLVVNATSASGAIAERWSRPYRVVMTATRTGGERNATRFGAFWADALGSDAADRDKDNVVTAQEAWDYAVRKVGDAFKADAAVATEHAKLVGADPARFVVARLGAAAKFAGDAALVALRNEQSGVEHHLAQLRALKPQLARDDYYNRIEPVLVELARIGMRVDARLAALGVGTAGADDATR